MDNLPNDQQLSLLKRCLDAIPRAILITDCQQPDDPIVFINEAFRIMSGYEDYEILGKNCRFMQGPETDQEELKRLAIAVQAREPVHVTLVNYRKNGQKFLNDFTIAPVQDDQGNVTHCIAYEKEVT